MVKIIINIKKKKKHLLTQIVNKVISISDYQLLFLFDSIISYSVFTLNASQVDEINKSIDDQQKFLKDC